jgi:uncharacterized membrane protein
VFSKAAFVMSRIVEGVLILLGIVIFIVDKSTPYIAVWDVVAVVYLSIRVMRLRRDKQPVNDQADRLKGMLGPRLGLLFTLLASLVGIIAGLTIVIGDDNAEAAGIAKAVAVPAVLLAWGILHFGYAERYAQAYEAALPVESLVFPNTDSPTFIDFAYFSFTIGTTFSVSDVETQTQAIRSRILAHSILSFIYNTATLGIAIGVITG